MGAAQRDMDEVRNEAAHRGGWILVRLSRLRVDRMAGRQAAGEEAMTYRDMTFCTRDKCPVADCHRHMSSVPKDGIFLLSIADFDSPENPCPLRTKHDRQSAAALTGNQP